MRPAAALRLPCLAAVLAAVALAHQKPPPSAIKWNWDRAVTFAGAGPIALSQLPPARRKALTAAVAAELARNADRLRSAAAWRSLAPAARVALVRLGPKRRAAAVGFPWGCSGDGNGPISIFRWTGRGYRIVLSDIAQALTVQPATHAGLHDVLTSMHGSATESELHLFRFYAPLGRYWEVACYYANWPPAASLTQAQGPRITACGYPLPAPPSPNH